MLWTKYKRIIIFIVLTVQSESVYILTAEEATDIAEEVETEPVEEPEIAEDEEDKMKKRQWYNMVTYGLPNLMLTQM